MFFFTPQYCHRALAPNQHPPTKRHPSIPPPCSRIWLRSHKPIPVMYVAPIFVPLPQPRPPTPTWSRRAPPKLTWSPASIWPACLQPSWLWLSGSIPWNGRWVLITMLLEGNWIWLNNVAYIITDNIQLVDVSITQVISAIISCVTQETKQLISTFWNKLRRRLNRYKFIGYGRLNECFPFQLW